MNCGSCVMMSQVRDSSVFLEDEQVAKLDLKSSMFVFNLSWHSRNKL
jgi:ABC-type uncharacterized transport system ATPase component